MKSPAMAEALKPLKRLESLAREDNGETLKDLIRAQQEYKLRKDAGERSARDTPKRGGALPDGLLSIEQPEEPKARRYMANDASSAQACHCDGGGLYLRVVLPNECSWVFRYMLNGKAGTMGLGPYPVISLAWAREKAVDARSLKVDGKDPVGLDAAAQPARPSRFSAPVVLQPQSQCG
jgi:hypothetical protein